MKLTLIREDKNHQEHVRVLTINSLIDYIKNDTKEGTVGTLRRMIADCEHDGYSYSFADMHKLPRVFPAVELGMNRQKDKFLKEVNGLVLLNVKNLTNDREAEEVKRAAQCMPMTLAAFIGASGRSVKILVRATREDGSVPQSEEEAGDFYRRAYRMATAIYNGILPRPVTLFDTSGSLMPSFTESGVAFSFRRPLDPSPYLNKEARPFVVPVMSPPAAEPEIPLHSSDNQEDCEGGSKEEKNKEQRVRRGTEQLVSFLKDRYEFRHNTVMGYTEYRKKDSYMDFRPVDERTRNSFAMEARLSGLDVWDKDINRFVMSNMVRSYDPVDDYLWSVHNKWDGKDHIRALARCVPTDNPHWEDWFYTWFLGMVAQWLGRNHRYGNSVAPLLVSRQGYNKSTFCKSLIPNELQWGYNDSLVISDKKAVLQAMGQFLLINLDEFNAIPPKIQEGFLKNVIQLANVKVKRPYGRHVEVFPRLASFIATANMTDILADPSGCRRFIGVELTGPINIGRRINHEQLYAQAFHAVMTGEPYWFNAEQTALIMESNRRFQMQQPIEQFFFECFETVSDERDGEYLTATAIFTEVRKLAGSAVANANLIAFGRWLKNLPPLRNKHSKQGTLYLVRKKIL